MARKDLLRYHVGTFWVVQFTLLAFLLLEDRGMSIWNRLRKRCVLAALAVSFATLLLPGCSHFRFGSYECFDEWYVGRADDFDPQDLGFASLDGDFTGYVVNDLIIRTPVFVVHEGIRTILVPVAVPYYAGCALVEGCATSNTEPSEDSN